MRGATSNPAAPVAAQRPTPRTHTERSPPPCRPCPTTQQGGRARLRQRRAPRPAPRPNPRRACRRPARCRKRTARKKPAAWRPPGVNATIEPLDRVRVDSSGRHLTTNQGVPVADNQNSLKYGVRGPALLEDFILREKITHFDHERIPERIVHARGSGAHGFFECYEPISRRSPRPRRSRPPARSRRCSCASPPCRASAAPRTRRATCAASPSSSIPTKATGTWWATTSRCSSSRTR
jgi:hypothetical protein